MADMLAGGTERRRSAIPTPTSRCSIRAFRNMCSANAAIERIAGGCRFTEGPVWFGDGRYLLWSDIPNDRIMKWEEETGAISVWRRPSHYANGNTRDRQGRLVTCEMGAQRLTRTEYDGTITVLAERFDGKRLTGPNDVVVKSDGSIWFSDNGAGIRGNYLGDKGEPELPFRVYRLDPRSGTITVVVDQANQQRPNGLAFSPDETRLYVVDTPGGDKTTYVYDVVDDGAGLTNGADLLQRDARLCRRHPARYRRQCLVRFFGRRGRGRRCGVRAGWRPDRPHPAARALRQCLFRRPQAQPPVHGREPVNLRALCRSPGRPGRITKYAKNRTRALLALFCYRA